MTEVRHPQGMVVAPEVAATFALAIGSYSRSLQGQAAAVAAMSEKVTTGWIEGVSDVLRALDKLRQPVPDPACAVDLQARVTEIAGEIELRLTSLMAEVQRQDMVRQMMDSISGMATAIGDLDLAELVTSTEAALHPRRIVEATEAGFVMDTQREAVQAQPASATGAAPDLELF